MDDILTDMNSIIEALQEIAENYRRRAEETREELELMRCS